jgi:glutamine synthetase
VQKADEVLELKYVVANIAHAYGKTATFMPKPLVGDNGNGMHVHQSLAKDARAVTNISIFVDFFRVPASFFGVNFVATAAHVSIPAYIIKYEEA